ncbi:MAG: hypothetical protein ACFBSD_09430 [Paracoccaceae bacterium]
MEVIQLQFARAGIAASGTSEIFLNQMQVLRDARAWSSRAGSDLPRFSDNTIRYLERALLGRGADLRDAVFQLSHLLSLSARLSARGRALDILYGYDGPIRARGLAAYLAERAAEGDTTECQEKAFVLTYGSGESYRLAHARLPLLVALMEFLLTCPSAPEKSREVMANIAEIEAAHDRFDAVRTASNAIAALVNGLLDTMMRSRVERDRFETLMGFLDATAEEGDAGVRHWVIDDDAILDFWLRGVREPDRAEDFRQFRTVHRGFVALVLALRQGEDWQRLYRATPVDAEDSVVQLAEDQGSFETTEDEPTTPLDDLAEDPLARVKFLTGAEEKGLEIAVRMWGPVRAFPLSVLRSEVMGAAQNEIINAVRFRRELGPLIALEKHAKPGQNTAAGYDEAVERYAKLKAHLRQMLRACAYVTAERRGLSVPEEQLAAARKAFKATRRQGFAEAFDDDEVGRAFEAAISPLAQLSDLLGGLADRLPDGLTDTFQADRKTFSGAFHELYAKED